MASITLKDLPVEIHRKIKLIQFDLEDKGKKMNLPDIYLMLVEKGLKEFEKENPTE